MKDVVFLGGKQAGCVGLLTIMAMGCNVKCVVSYDVLLSNLANALGFTIYHSIKVPAVAEILKKSDLLISVHCREIVTKELLRLPRLGSLNIHPCLYRYKGADPVHRLLQDGCKMASVGVHRMTEVVDEGEVLSELYVDVFGKKTLDEIYNTLYPYYSMALIEALRKYEASSCI